MEDESTVPARRGEEGIRPPGDPRYPPQSVLRSDVRRSALFSSVGLLVVLAAVIGLGMLYWVVREKGRVDPSTPQAVGTVGTAPGGVGRTEGGFDPQPRPGSTREELELRGGASVLTDIDDLVRGTPTGIAGRQVDIRNVEVESGSGPSFWIKDGDAKIAVVTNGDARVTPGKKVDVTGVAESDGSGGVRVRAQRVETH